MITVTIEPFASVKDYLTANQSVLVPMHSTLKEFRNTLLQLGMAESLLLSLRFVKDNSFISEDYIFQEHDHILLLPPSSGG